MNGHPTLDNKTYDMYHKNLFHTKLINMDIVSPEPYRLNEYFNQNGIDFMLDFYQDIENILINKKYIHQNNNEDSNIFTTKECYTILGIDISEDISLNELKKIYRRKAIELHPDKHPNGSEIYQNKFQDLTKAYKQLLTNYKSK